MVRKVSLICGILSSLLYVAMNVFVPMQWEGYSSASQTVSELSAIGAPTRPLWVSLAIVYTLLVAAFGRGVWQSADRNRHLRIAGGLLATALARARRLFPDIQGELVPRSSHDMCFSQDRIVDARVLDFLKKTRTDDRDKITERSVA